MRFKQWIEDTTVSGDQYGNDPSPDDRGLVRQQYLTKAVPDSEMANKLFGVKYMGTGQSFEVPFTRIYGWRPKVIQTVQEIQAGKLSQTKAGVTLSRLDSPRGSFFVIDGYHRIIESAMAGGKSIQATIDEYTPRIERTGGAWKNKVADKIPILSYGGVIKSPNTNV